jgi:hypothetical protein
MQQALYSYSTLSLQGIEMIEKPFPDTAPKAFASKGFPKWA